MIDSGYNMCHMCYSQYSHQDYMFECGCVVCSDCIKFTQIFTDIMTNTIDGDYYKTIITSLRDKCMKCGCDKKILKKQNVTDEKDLNLHSNNANVTTHEQKDFTTEYCMSFGDMRLGKRWTHEEEIVAIGYFNDGLDIVEISRKLLRSPNSVAFKLFNLKVIPNIESAPGYDGYKNSKWDLFISSLYEKRRNERLMSTVE